MRVFLSYAPADKDWAKALASQLSNAGRKLWYPDEELFPGDNWQLRIGQALEESDAMIVLLSPRWAESRSARQEIQYALGSPKFDGRLISVLVRPTNNIHWILRRLQALEGDPIEVSKRIVDILKRPPNPTWRGSAPLALSDSASVGRRKPKFSAAERHRRSERMQHYWAARRAAKAAAGRAKSASATTSARRKPKFSAAERQRRAERMRQYWARRRASKK